MDAVAEIKKLYYAATKGTIDNDIDRAIDLLKTLPTEEERDRAAVYMEGLAQMRIEWKQAMRGGVGPQKAQKAQTNSRATAGSRPPSGARTPGGPPARSDRSKASSRRSR
jgi:hypothetical protein